MPRPLHHAAAAVLCAATLAAAAAALAPVATPSGPRELLDHLRVLRDGHGALALPQPDDPPRRNP
jgi:hypothetical protein